MFKILEEEKGIFSLIDPVYNKEVKWKLTDQARPGLMIVMNNIDTEVEKLSVVDIKEVFLKGSEEEKVELEKRIMRLTERRMGIMSSFVEHVDPMPEIYDSKMEFLASCLCDKDDIANINTFFLTRYTDITKNQGVLSKEEEPEKQKAKD